MSQSQVYSTWDIVFQLKLTVAVRCKLRSNARLAGMYHIGQVHVVCPLNEKLTEADSTPFSHVGYITKRVCSIEVTSCTTMAVNSMQTVRA